MTSRLNGALLMLRLPQQTMSRSSTSTSLASGDTKSFATPTPTPVRSRTAGTGNTSNVLRESRPSHSEDDPTEQFSRRYSRRH